MATEKKDYEITDLGEDWEGHSGKQVQDFIKKEITTLQDNADKNTPSSLRCDTDTKGIVKLQMQNVVGEALGDEVQFSVGSGGGEAKDEPREGGTDAFSTGGAYSNIPTGLNVDTETEGVVKLQMKNAAGEAIGDETQFAVGTGSGGGGTVVTIIPKKTPFYCKSGTTVTLPLSIRSVTTSGKQETQNTIERLEIWDRDTNQLLENKKLNQASSADAETFDFEVDLTSYFTSAGGRKFKLVAYDDSENSGTRNINVTAVDVTVTSSQTLNYTSTTALGVGGTTKSLPMYRFANNASDQGILCTTEIYLDGEWQVLGTATVSDTYTHSVSINPKNTLGKALSHGAYQLRIHGVDVASGVEGNYLYTTIMVVESGNTTPIIATRYYADTEVATIKQYETASIDFAVYSLNAATVTAKVLWDGEEQGDRQCYRATTYTYTQRIQGVETDGTYTAHLKVICDTMESATADFKVVGSLLDIEPVTTQLMLDMDFSNRSNTESDKGIKYGDYTLELTGANWSTNGFVKDTFGTAEYGSEGDTGIMALRIAENVRGVLDYKPFNNTAIETNGMALQWRMRVKNVADDNARLMQCMSNGWGFYVTGTQVVLTTDGNETVAKSIASSIENDALVDVAIVIEPTSQAPYGGIGVMKMYFDGELIGACYYTPGTLARHDTKITFDGTEADLYLYNIRAWETYYSFEQSFNNYLLKLSDTDAMITEYTFNKVFASQSAEGTPAKNRPQASELYSRGLPYFVVCKNADTDDTDDQYPDYLETLDGDKKTKRVLDVYAYFPDRPWQDFKAIGVTVTNQGTTSSQRPIKNIKMKLKAATVSLLHTADEYTGDELAKYNACAKNAAKHKVTIYEDSLPTNIITVKVDYSESGGANNGASTQLYNELQRALGDNYVTPAQRFNADGHVINTSINSIPCAFCRTDTHSADATSPSYGYFHAKGNWNEDKGDAKVFGFEGVNGYNADCLCYGDFYELVANQGETLDELLARVPTSGWAFEESKNDDGTVNYWQTVVLSEFCGPGHKVFRKQEDGSWLETTGTMSFVDGAWKVTGDVVNPVENYELLKYDALDWMQGVDSVDDMLAPDSDGNPIWLQYYESRYPDDDNLNELYESGKKVPYNLYSWLRFCQECNHDLTEADGNITLDGATVEGTKENRLRKWEHELHDHANVHATLCYHVFTDYIAAVDQRSKNMMVGFYLDTDGVTRMYLNHLYDGDTILGSDNDCGLTVPSMLDPDTDTAYYQGWNSVLFQQIKNAGTDGFWLDASGTSTITTRQVAAAMRTQTLKSGLIPFSPAGLTKYWITDRLSKWPKLVSSFDGLRKYVEHSKSTANYFFALHGLSIQRLRTYVKERFLFRDGFYRTGDLYSSTFNMRISASEDVTIRIKAAKDGFFGLAVERVDSITDSCYLKEGEEYTLKANSHILGAGNMMYVLGANRLAEVDISCGTVSESGWSISEMSLLRKLAIGGESHAPVTITAGALKNLNLGSMPFLEELDIRNTGITSVNATYCPRLVTLLAAGSKLATLTLAETCPISTLALPDTMTSLSFKNLPSLSYPDGGLQMDSLAGIKSVTLSGCSQIDGLALLNALMEANAPLATLEVSVGERTGASTLLEWIKSTGAHGSDDEADVCSGLTGKWWMEQYLDDDTLSSLRAYFPGLDLRQSRYSAYREDDLETDPANFTNLDNKTGYAFGTEYVRSGHIMKIRELSCPVSGKYDKNTKKMTLSALSKEDYGKYADGTTYDKTGSNGEGYDTFVYLPSFWYKGINDYINQRKYTLMSSELDEPEPTWTRKNEALLSETTYKEGCMMRFDDINVGDTLTDESFQTSSSMSVGRMDVGGMAQVRYITINNESICSVFTDADGKVIQKDVLSISGTTNSPLDFMPGYGDYIFRKVPDGARYLYFVFSQTAVTNEKAISEGGKELYRCIAVDSEDIEAVEPGWVRFDSQLVGVYTASLIDGKVWSLSTGKSWTSWGKMGASSAGWDYDSDGNPTMYPADPITNAADTYETAFNLAILRGKGFYMGSYEIHKIIKVLYVAWFGTREWYNKFPQVSTANNYLGSTDSGGFGECMSQYSHKIWGIEAWANGGDECLDNLQRNISSWKAYKANRREHTGTDITGWHVYDPKRDVERIAPYKQEFQQTSSIARFHHGRYCDIFLSAVGTSNALSYCGEQTKENTDANSVPRRQSYGNDRRSAPWSWFGGTRMTWTWYGKILARLTYCGDFANEGDIDPRVSD